MCICKLYLLGISICCHKIDNSKAGNTLILDICHEWLWEMTSKLHMWIQMNLWIMCEPASVDIIISTRESCSHRWEFTRSLFGYDSAVCLSVFQQHQLPLQHHTHYTIFGAFRLFIIKHASEWLCLKCVCAPLVSSSH